MDKHLDLELQAIEKQREDPTAQNPRRRRETLGHRLRASIIHLCCQLLTNVILKEFLTKVAFDNIPAILTSVEADFVCNHKRCNGWVLSLWCQEGN